jgi:integrase
MRLVLLVGSMVGSGRSSAPMRKRQTRAAPGSGSVYWSGKQARYVAEVYLGRDERDVKVKKRLVGPRGDKSEEARSGLRDRLKQLVAKNPAPRRGQRRTVSRITLGEYLTAWLAARDPANRLSNDITRRKRLSDAAYAAYHWAIEEYIIPHLGTKRLQDINHTALRHFLDSLDLSDGSKEKIRTALQAALHDAMVSEEPLITANPAARLEFERTSPAKETEAWNKNDALKFLRTAKNTEHFPLFLLMIVGALGPAEAFGIKWGNVDLESGKVAITANLTEVGGKLIFKETKTKHRRRSVTLPAIALSALKARFKKLRPEASDYVFTAPGGGGIRRTTFRQRVWLPLIKKAKVPVITLYGLRHSAASLMAAMGVPLLIASRALGHSKVGTTANTYTHLFEETSREVAGKFDELLKGI